MAADTGAQRASRLAAEAQKHDARRPLSGSMVNGAGQAHGVLRYTFDYNETELIGRCGSAGTLDVTEGELGQALVPFARAGVEELVRMVLGHKVYTHGSDIRECRLLLLIKHVFDGRITGAAEVSE